MEGFSSIDIFDTKGTEYLFVIGYLLILIIFWQVANKPIITTKQIQKVLGSLSINLLRIPQGIFYNKNHTWVHLEESGAAKVGLDDFLLHVTGEVELSNLKNPGQMIEKGDLLTMIDKGGKQLKVYSPISGKILNTNSLVKEDNEILNEDPYDDGWIYKIKPSSWVKETESYFLAEEAIDWSTKELNRFKDFLAGDPMRRYSSEPSMILLQDGGEIRENVLSELPNEVWEKFQEEFLDFS